MVGWTGFGAQLSHVPPPPHASTPLLALHLHTVGELRQGAYSFSTCLVSLKAQSLEERLPIPWGVEDEKQRRFGYLWVVSDPY